MTVIDSLESLRNVISHTISTEERFMFLNGPLFYNSLYEDQDFSEALGDRLSIRDRQ
jgi:hypothetical protein